jgi:carbamoyl-phosphate synthase large subunit
MNISAILITGVGGGVGQSIIKSLQGSPFRLIGVDGEILGTGLYAVEKAYKIPYASDPLYIPTLLDICQSEQCSLIFPGLDAELIPLAKNAKRFLEIGVTPIVSKSSVIKISDNKYATSKFLVDHGFPAPHTKLADDNLLDNFSFPFVLKPLIGGARSKGVFLVKNEQELRFRISTIDVSNYVAQEYLPGEEYTCGSVNFHGKCYGVILMERELRNGDTYKAFVVKDAELSNFVREVAEKLKPFGPCNFQLRLVDGIPYIFEINARCSGTTFCRTMVGFNEPKMTIEYLISKKKPNFEIRTGTILRYWKEILIDNGQIEDLENLGEINGVGHKL